MSCVVVEGFVVKCIGEDGKICYIFFWGGIYGLECWVGGKCK